MHDKPQELQSLPARPERHGGPGRGAEQLNKDCPQAGRQPDKFTCSRWMDGWVDANACMLMHMCVCMCCAYACVYIYIYTEDVRSAQ